jgi:hypothetical protein
MNPSATVPTVAGTFSPLRTYLRLDGRSYSPAVLERIVEAAARLHSCADAAFALQLAGVAISARHVGRLAAEVGAEMARQRDEKVARRRRRELPVRVATPPELVAVEVDGGRLRTRAVGCGPGVHGKQNKEDKVACLVSLQGETHQQDPRPEPPESFLQPRRVRRLVQAMKGQAGEAPKDEGPQEEANTPEEAPKAPAGASEAPAPVVRTAVASMVCSDAFGPMMAAEAQERGFYQANRRAFVADGAAYNWAIQRGYFPDFEPITDLLHVLCYVYLAAWAVGGDDAARWSIYVGWLTACWQGRVKEVIAALGEWQGKIGEPPGGEELDRKDPRRLVAEALSYLGNNEARMDYPRYRKEGLPTTSSLAESLVGQFNARVKGPDKYWNQPEGAEAILQLRAAVLSEDGRLGRFFAQRPGCPYRSRKVA